MGWPDKAVRELCFRVYNEHIAELQERSDGRFYGVGMINWWDGEGARKTLAEMKDLGLTTFWLPLKPGAGDDGKPIDYNSPAMYPVWEAIEERSEEHTSELQSLMRISYAVFCLQKTKRRSCVTSQYKETTCTTKRTRKTHNN